MTNQPTDQIWNRIKFQNLEFFFLQNKNILSKSIREKIFHFSGIWGVEREIVNHSPSSWWWFQISKFLWLCENWNKKKFSFFLSKPTDNHYFYYYHFWMMIMKHKSVCVDRHQHYQSANEDMDRVRERETKWLEKTESDDNNKIWKKNFKQTNNEKQK